MAKKKFVLFRNEIRDFCNKGWKTRVIGGSNDIILVEAEVPEEDMAGKNSMAIENLINDPGER